jgi:hypothetical protein
MLDGIDPPPEVEARCPDCELRVIVSMRHERPLGPASLLCLHPPWSLCPKLDLAKARRTAQRGGS